MKRLLVCTVLVQYLYCTGTEVEQLGADIGINLTYDTEDIAVSLGYDAEFKDSYLAHTGSIEVRFRY